MLGCRKEISGPRRVAESVSDLDRSKGCTCFHMSRNSLDDQGAGQGGISGAAEARRPHEGGCV